MFRRFNPVFSDRSRLRNGWWIAIFVTVLFTSLGAIATLTRQQDIGIYKEALLLVGTTWMVQRLRRKPLTEVTGRFDRNWLRQLCIGAVIGTLMLVPAIGVLVACGEMTFQYVGGSATFVRWAIFYLCVGISEELLFRGFVFRSLIDGLGFWQAQVICAAMFLLVHLANPGLDGVSMVFGSFNLVLFSLAMGYLALTTESLAAPIGIHAAADLMQGGVLGLGTSGLYGGQGLFQTAITGPAWLTGGTFGLEGSLPELMVTSTLLILICWANESGWIWVLGGMGRPVNSTAVVDGVQAPRGATSLR
jgi:membrane protease YdiL (CAAX protease family)